MSAWSRWTANGEIEAPTIFVASPHLTGREQGNDFVVNTPEEAREAVRKSKAAGYDFIKVTTFVKPEVCWTQRARWSSGTVLMKRFFL